MGQADFATESILLAHKALSQGWQVQASDEFLKFTAPTGQVTFFPQRAVPGFADRSLATVKARLTRDGLAL